MKGIVCSVCGYIAINGAAPDNCPVCGAAKTAFKENEEAIKTPQDAANLTETEKKHTPSILVLKKCGLIPECTDVHVRVGEIKHPMLPEHFIGHIDFYLDGVFLSRVILTPEKPNPACALHLNVKSGKITVLASCNVHGVWIGEKEL